MEARITTETIAVQFRKAPLPIAVTEAGMTTETSTEQPAKACLPISVMEAGMATECEEKGNKASISCCLGKILSGVS